MRTTMARAEQFLAMVSMLSALLAAVAIAMAARRFMLRHIDACAMLRCLGLTQNQVTSLYLIEFFILGVVASAAVVALGLQIADPLIGLGITLVILRITWHSWRTVRGHEHGH